MLRGMPAVQAATSHGIWLPTGGGGRRKRGGGCWRERKATMAMIFIGGSRDIVALPDPAVERIGAIVAAEHGVLVGDAPGADTEVQAPLAGHGYEHVGVFCAGKEPRNNLDDWAIYRVPPNDAGGFSAWLVRCASASADAAGALHSGAVHCAHPCPPQPGRTIPDRNGRHTTAWSRRVRGLSCPT